MDAFDNRNRSAGEKELSDTTVMSMPSKTSYQECGNQSLAIQFDPTGRYLLIPTIIGIKVMEWSTNKCRTVIGKGDASTLRFLGGCLCLGDARVDKQILLARVADSAMGESDNGSDGGKENDPLSESILITTAFNKRRFYIFSHKDDPIALADEEHGDGEVQQQATISRDILNEPPDSDDLILNTIWMEPIRKNPHLARRQFCEPPWVIYTSGVWVSVRLLRG